MGESARSDDDPPMLSFSPLPSPCHWLRFVPDDMIVDFQHHFLPSGFEARVLTKPVPDSPVWGSGTKLRAQQLRPLRLMCVVAEESGYEQKASAKA
jgi:hypothetical protein